MNLFWKNQKIKSKRYCSQLDQQKVALGKKCLENRKCIIFNQVNARPHVSLISRQKLLQLGWVVLISVHLDFFISVFTKFSTWKKKNSNSLEDCKSHLEQLFAQTVLGRDFPGVPVVTNQPSNSGGAVRSLIWELRSHLLQARVSHPQLNRSQSAATEIQHSHK